MRTTSSTTTTGNATLQGRVVSEPGEQFEERPRPALRAWYRMLPVFFVGWLIYLLYLLTTTPALVFLLMPFAMLFMLPVIMGIMVPPMKPLFDATSAVGRGVLRGARGAARGSLRAASPPPNSSSRGGPIPVQVVEFRLRDTAGTEHICVARGVAPVVTVGLGDEVEVLGKLDRFGHFDTRLVRSRAGVQLLRTRVPRGWYAEYAARAAWVLLALWIVSIVAGRS